VTLRALATAINAHLKRIERERLAEFHNAGCYYMGGARLRITYCSRAGGETLSRGKAESYLLWLNAGNVGRHTQHMAANAFASTKVLDGMN
jgi:hypothetical protein